MEKKTFEQFTEAMRNEAEKLGTVRVEEITRTDVKYTGLFIEAESEVPTPVVNLTALYDEYEKGERDMAGCVRVVHHILEQSCASQNQVEDIKTWDSAKTMLFLRPFGNITGGIYRQIEDIYLVPYLQLTDDGSTLVRVTDGLLKMWGVTEDKIFEIARENQETLRPVKIEGLGDKIGVPDILPGYIISTSNGMFGASAIFYKDIEETIREKLDGEDFYILPSSVHEVIVMPVSMGANVSDLQEMVATINSTEVDERDRLTNTVYIFDNGEFKQAG